MKGIVYFLFLILLSTTIYAQGLAVSPSRLNFEIYRGETAQGQLTIFNPSHDEINYHVYSQDQQSWFHFSNDNGILEPYKSKIIKLKVRPIDAANGEYNTLINVMTNGLDAKGINLNLGTAIKTRIEITGKQVVDLDVNKIEVADTEQGSMTIFTVDISNNGNVRTTPEIEVTIIRSNKVIDKYKLELVELLPRSNGQFLINWSTLSNEIGDYTAQLKVFAGNEVIHNQELKFQILPYGTISRSGVFESLMLDSEPKLGETLKLKAIFHNNGKANVNTRLACDLYYNSKLTKQIQSNQKLTLTNSNTELLTYIEPLQPGSYKAECKILYGGVETPVKQIEFDVNSNHTYVKGAAITFSVVAIGLLVYEFYSRIKNKPFYTLKTARSSATSISPL